MSRPEDDEGQVRRRIGGNQEPGLGVGLGDGRMIGCKQEEHLRGGGQQ